MPTHVKDRLWDMADVPPEGRMTVAARRGERSLVASQAIMPGQRLMLIDGEPSRTPCRYSVQVDRNLHISPPAAVIEEDRSDAYLWRFLNHSCAPNSAIVRRVLIAIGPILPGDDITFDYNTTEYEMASPFTCRCGHCDGLEIRGYRYLDAAQRQKREHMIEPYLRDAVEEAL